MSIFGGRFRGGVHPPEMKETASSEIVRFEAPEKLYIHLFQGFGSPSNPIVKKGDRVLKGSVIAEPSSKFSAFLHSPVSGIVEGIVKWPHSSGKMLDAVAISNDFENKSEIRGEARIHDQLTSRAITEIIRNSGIVGLGGAAFPTDIKLSPPVGKKIDFLIVNGCECEPYLTSDDRLMIERTDEIAEGAKIAARVLSAPNIVFAVEDNKREAIAELKKKEDSRISVSILPTRYPQGGEKQLIFAVLKRKVPAGGLPADVGCVVINVQTAFSIYRSVVYGVPLYERVVTLGGFFRKPGNILAPIGTTVGDIINARGGIPDDVDKIVLGGVMMGVSVSDLRIPVAKGTSGILLLKTEKKKEFNCIRCLRCSDVCPMNLTPRLAYYLYKKGDVYDGAKNCIECGSCAYICPARIPLVHYLKWAKAK
ncbi:MAG: electron transport complex subunit RsxC [Elusimicrobia bacterium]|nr:electron transport complex subunit RsxC [Elusimicrobiota bacterium]